MGKDRRKILIVSAIAIALILGLSSCGLSDKKSEDSGGCGTSVSEKSQGKYQKEELKLDEAEKEACRSKVSDAARYLFLFSAEKGEAAKTEPPLSKDAPADPTKSVKKNGKVWVPPVYKTVHHDAIYETRQGERKVWICDGDGKTHPCGRKFYSLNAWGDHKAANGG